ncbi:MAG: hypothetical protein HOP29_14050 [Phycisphaerales bacterium]|nr:hypothetical protein [Phycisphaerales bacterium]
MTKASQCGWSMAFALAAALPASGGNESVVLSTGAAGGGAYDAVATVHHEARHDNRLAWLTTGDGASPPSQTSTPTPHDTNGNLTGDGAYVYQYDAFNRLVQVRTPSQPGGGGNVPLIGLLYDGLGRLAATTHDTVSPSRKTWLFHDGVRRIAEWAAEWDKNEEAFVATATEREYVYGPDYVDEHVAQIVPGNPDATPYPIPDKVVYTLQDANYNVVALLDDVGNVLRQYSWTPYGQLDDSDALASHPANRIGHQGLFWISFAADSVDPNGDLSDDLFPPLPQSADLYFRPDLNGLYYSRARFYSPHLGRFLTPDPNETSLPLLTAAYMNGQTAMASLGLFNAEALYADGMNLYAAYGVNPLTNRDAIGLSYNPYDDWVDEQIDYLNGHRLYALGMLNEGAKAASVGLNLALDIAGSVLGVDTFKAIFKVTTGSGGFWDAMEIALSVTPFIGPLRGATRAIDNAMDFAATAKKGGRIAGKASKFLGWLNQGPKNVSVYIAKRDGRAVYVGVSGDVSRRMSQHGARFTGQELVASDLTRNQARALEQLIMDKNVFQNVRNSIDPMSEFFVDAYNWAEEFARRSGIRLVYD